MGKRISSEIRTDTGNGAARCSHQSFEVIASTGRGWRLGLKTLGCLLLSILVWAFLPVKFNDWQKRKSGLKRAGEEAGARLPLEAEDRAGAECVVDSEFEPETRERIEKEGGAVLAPS
jgi:hypothetical protein